MATFTTEDSHKMKLEPRMFFDKSWWKILHQPQPCVKTVFLLYLEAMTSDSTTYEHLWVFYCRLTNISTGSLWAMDSALLLRLGRLSDVVTRVKPRGLRNREQLEDITTHARYTRKIDNATILGSSRTSTPMHQPAVQPTTLEQYHGLFLTSLIQTKEQHQR